MSGVLKMENDTDLETDADTYIPYIEHTTLTKDDKHEVEQAMRDANAALRSACLPPMNLPFSKLTGQQPRHVSTGETQVTSFKDCKNIHIGNNIVVTNHHHGKQSSSKSSPKISQEVLLMKDNKRQLTTDQKSCAAKDIGSGWRKLGRELGITDGELDGIQFDYKDEGLHEITYQMLRKWEQKRGVDATIGCLIQAFIKIDRPDIAQNVFVQK